MHEAKISCCAVMLLVFIVSSIVGFDSVVRISSVGQGEHTGYVTAVEQEGYFYKNLRVYVKTSLESSQEDVYCVNGNQTNIKNELQQAQKDKRIVTIKYQGVNGIGLGLCRDYEVIGVNQ